MLVLGGLAVTTGSAEVVESGSVRMEVGLVALETLVTLVTLVTIVEGV